MTTWYTSDTHFGHARIIEYCKRPFKDVVEMNWRMIDEWNARVGPNDLVYHLGDVLLGPSSHFESTLARLMGRIVLIRGNHDGKKTLATNRFEAVIETPHVIQDGGKTLVLYHYPILSWPFRGHGSIHLHGHSHGSVASTRHRIDVGVDCWNFKPVTWAEIEARRQTWPIQNDDNHRSPEGE